MNINDFDKVSELVDRKKELEKQRNNVSAILKSDLDEYWCSLSKHTDGSGWKINLTGHYVAREMLEVTADVIDMEIDRLNTELRSLGVGVSV